ncbi:DNA polymerase III subunit epsilon [Longibacter salinarum]|uniref:DNA polymerase III subunit epsilon n=1 Tax=Longibacter salinarum TaxID=1850348 RepID=A0A2A8D372_9BACT|nr:3'-5' exonuclease [Longibacter salinarum]PEN15257.1 DNA polymerase III subunit epsilon [Longibacter salinarum]
MIRTLRRKWYRAQANGAMAKYLSVPLPSKREDVRALEFLALDLETTGLDSATDRIVSIGSVRIAGDRILGNSARHTLIQIDGSVQQSATIHQITDTDLDTAVPERSALDATLDELSGRVLLVHHAAMDYGFLNAACHRHYNMPLITRTVDTLKLARHLRERGNQQIKEGELRLHALRTAYGLPRYAAHNALSDAVATAELYLALLPRWAGRDALPLRTILA